MSHLPAASGDVGRTRPQTSPAIVLFLIAMTITAYWGIGRCGFVNLDDDAYVEHQPMVNQGLRPAAIVWAWTAVHSSNWHPLTSLAHIVDCDLFGLSPLPMHGVSLVWHILNTVLVYFVWRALTGATWRSAIVAALFALHPLHVESVAWISERKDVLSTFFWLVGLALYVGYVRHPSVIRYVLIALALILALLAKPMAVTFPCTLLLLDLWPLRRWPRLGWWMLLREKIPLFVIVFAHSVATFFAQHSSGAADFGQRFSLADRLGNAVVAYVRYLGKTFWPNSLAPFYPHPGQWPAWTVAGSLALIATISVVAWRLHRTHGWFAFGWLWFLGTLVPVIGIVQVGAQSMADRYTYVPLLGVFTLFVWGAAALATHGPKLRRAFIGMAIVAVSCSGFLTQKQVSAWENSISLYERSIAAGQDNATVRYLLAVATQAAGRPEAEAVAHYRRALAFEPDYINASTQLAILALNHQRIDEARQLLEANRRAQPLNPGVHVNLGSFFSSQNQRETAIVHFNTALRLKPDHPDAHRGLAKLAVTEQRYEDAIVHLESLVKALPWDPIALCELGTLQANLQRFERAKACLERAVWINPNYPAARENLRSLQSLMDAKR